MESNESELPVQPGTEIQASEEQVNELLGKGKSHAKYVRFIVAALGAIPWVGSLISASASLSGEIEQEGVNELQRLWLREHQGKIKDLVATLQDICRRLDGFGDEIQERIESPDYLALVRKTFVSWDQADTKEKRQMFQRLITNAGAIELCPDDLVRLFISWINQYHEAHFLVIREIYKNPGITRGDIWAAIHGEIPREDSAEADLYRYLIRDLSTGSVIRQERETNESGQFVKRPRSTRGTPSGVMESAFEDTKGYRLTQLGEKFVHYVMADVAPQIEAPPQS